MRRFVFQLADYSHDKEIRDILRTNYSMDGNIKLCFTTEPSYFDAINVMGRENYVIVCRDTYNNVITGFGTCSLRQVYINGKVVEIGYLSHLRLKKEYRRATLLSRGYKFFKDLFSNIRIPLYLTTIFEDNYYAHKILTSQRGDLPYYKEVGRYCTVCVALSRKMKKISYGLRIERGSRECLGAIVKFMNEVGKDKQFYPFYKEEDFRSHNGMLRDFKVTDFYLALKNNQIVGILAKWDQSSFRQTEVAGYSFRFKFLRPFWNWGGKIFGYPPLPSPRSLIKYFYISFVAVSSNNPEIFRVLLRQVYNDYLGKGYMYFLLGFSVNDPLLKVAEEYHPIKCYSRIFVVSWGGIDTFYEKLESRVPYLEVATL